MESDFKASFESVASAFGAKPDEGRMFVYLKTFRHLTQDQWQTLCDWATQNCDRFPTIKDMIRGSYECGMVARPKLADMDKDVMTVVCACGASFVFHRNAAMDTYKCPGDGCHVSYDSILVLREADRYGVYWADREIRDALRSTITKAQAMKSVYQFLNGMHKDVDAQVTRKKTLKEIRAIRPTPAPEAMFAPSFDGTDPRPSPVA